MLTAKTSAAGNAQALGNASILAGETLTRVENKNYNVALGDCLLGLRRHLSHDALGVDGLEAASVDHDVSTRPDTAFAIVAVARQPGKIGDQRRARTRQAIEQRRLADIGTAHDRNDGFH